MLLMTHRNFFLKPNIIYEAIVTSYNNDGNPNAAPMGVIRDGEGKILIKPFKCTDTCTNLKDRKACVVNFTQNPELFVDCTLFQDELSRDTFSKSTKIDAPILKECETNHIGLKVISNQETTDKLRVTYECEVLYSKVKQKTVNIYTRAFSSLIEILIHTTRILAFRTENGKKDEIDHLMALIEHHSNIITRVVLDDSVYHKLLYKIKNKICE